MSRPPASGTKRRAGSRMPGSGWQDLLVNRVPVLAQGSRIFRRHEGQFVQTADSRQAPDLIQRLLSGGPLPVVTPQNGEFLFPLPIELEDRAGAGNELNLAVRAGADHRQANGVELAVVRPPGRDEFLHGPFVLTQERGIVLAQDIVDSQKPAAHPAGHSLPQGAKEAVDHVGLHQIHPFRVSQASVETAWPPAGTATFRRCRTCRRGWRRRSASVSEPGS